MSSEHGAQQGNKPDPFLEELSLRSAAAAGTADPLADLGIPIVHVAEEAASASNESLERVAAICLAKNANIRMRLPIQLWDGEQYVSWKGEIWKVEANDAEEAQEIRSALEVFFSKLGQLGAAAMIEKLKS